MSDHLFSEFDPVSAKQWKQKIQFDLKGADYNDTLVWESPEGVHVKPFYHSEDLNEAATDIPGQPNSWKILQRIFVDNAATANRLAIKALEGGAEALVLAADSQFDILKVLDGVSLKEKSVYFQLNFLSQEFTSELMDFCHGQHIDAYYGLDPAGKLARSGNWYKDLKTDHTILEYLVAKNPTRSLGVHMDLYQNAGANIVQQLAYGLAHCVEYLHHFEGTKQLGMTFHLALGHNYFFEIAKCSGRNFTKNNFFGYASAIQRT